MYRAPVVHEAVVAGRAPLNDEPGAVDHALPADGVPDRIHSRPAFGDRLRRGSSQVQDRLGEEPLL